MENLISLDGTKSHEGTGMTIFEEIEVNWAEY
jgi:hypothetical protein